MRGITAVIRGAREGKAAAEASMGLVPPDPLDPAAAQDLESYCFALMYAGVDTDEARELLRRAVALQTAAHEATAAHIRETEQAQEREERKRDAAMLAAMRLLTELHLTELEPEPEPPPQFTYVETLMTHDPLYDGVRG